MIEVVSKCSNILTETKIMNNSVTGERHVAVMAYTLQAGLGNLAYLGMEMFSAVVAASLLTYYMLE